MVLHNRLHIIDDARLEHLLGKVVGHDPLRSKGRRLERECFLRLTIECWIHNLTIDKDPQLLPDVVRLDGRIFLALLQMFHDPLDDLGLDMIHMLSTLDGSDVVHKRHLARSAIGHSKTDLPQSTVILGRIIHDGRAWHGVSSVGRITLCFRHTTNFLDRLHIHLHVLLKVANF